MKYFIIVNGETCTLPARTLEMDERIDMIRGLDRMIKAGEITRREARQEQYSFVKDCIAEPMPPFEQMDMGDLELNVTEIIAAYQRPATQAKLEAAFSMLKHIVSRPDVQKKLSRT